LQFKTKDHGENKTYIFQSINGGFVRSALTGLVVAIGAGATYIAYGDPKSLIVVFLGVLIMGFNSGYFYRCKDNHFGSYVSLYGFDIFRSSEPFDAENGYVSVMIKSPGDYQLQLITKRKNRFKLNRYWEFTDAWTNAFELARDLGVSIFDCSVREEKNAWIKLEEFDFYEKQLTQKD
jgi:hypothetical protein